LGQTNSCEAKGANTDYNLKQKRQQMRQKNTIDHKLGNDKTHLDFISVQMFPSTQPPSGSTV